MGFPHPGLTSLCKIRDPYNVENSLLLFRFLQLILMKTFYEVEIVHILTMCKLRIIFMLDLV